MALSAVYINNMVIAKKEDVDTSKGKNLRRNKRCLDISDEENCIFNVKKLKTNSLKHINSNAMVDNSNNLKTIPEDMSPSFRCRKCLRMFITFKDLTTHDCAGCNQFNCVKCDLKFVTRRKLDDHAKTHTTTSTNKDLSAVLETLVSRGLVTTTNTDLSAVPGAGSKMITCRCSFSPKNKKNLELHKLFGCEVPKKEACNDKIYKCTKEKRIRDKFIKLFTCLCSFSSNKKKDIKLHKLFDCKFPTKEARNEKISKCKKQKRIRDKINMLFGATPTKPKHQANDLATSNSNSLSTRIKISNEFYENHLYKLVNSDGLYEKYDSSSKGQSSLNSKSAEKQPNSTKKKSPEKHTASSKDPSSGKHGSSSKDPRLYSIKYRSSEKPSYNKDKSSEKHDYLSQDKLLEKLIEKLLDKHTSSKDKRTEKHHSSKKHKSFTKQWL